MFRRSASHNDINLEVLEADAFLGVLVFQQHPVLLLETNYVEVGRERERKQEGFLQLSPPW
jgi:hypothetical protein